MSLDNVLAIAAIANGAILLLLFGLLASIFLLLVASTFLAKLFERFPLFLYGAGVVLAWTAGTMIYTDKTVFPYLDHLDSRLPGPSFALLFPAALSAMAAIVIIVTERHRTKSLLPTKAT